MAAQNALKDENSVGSALFENSTVSGETRRGQINQSTGRILTDSGTTGATATTWTVTGNTRTITNAAVTAASMVVFMYATPPAGFWSVVCGSGTFTITSSDSESAGLAFTYKVFL